jgi:hypothetical protein
VAAREGDEAELASLKLTQGVGRPAPQANQPRGPSGSASARVGRRYPRGAGEEIDAIRKGMDRARSEMPWYEQIVRYDEPLYSPEVDTVAWEIYSLGGFDAGPVPIEVEGAVMRSDPRLPTAEPLAPQVVDQLRGVRDEAERLARHRDWDPEPRLAVIRETVRRRWDARRP